MSLHKLCHVKLVKLRRDTVSERAVHNTWYYMHVSCTCTSIRIGQPFFLSNQAQTQKLRAIVCMVVFLEKALMFGLHHFLFLLHAELPLCPPQCFVEL